MAELTEKKEQVVGLYDRCAPTYDGIGPNFFGHFGRELVARANVQEGDQVLDVASGRGATLLPLMREVGNRGSVVGIDLSDSMLSRLDREAHLVRHSGFSLYKMDAEAITFEDDCFSHVICGFALFFFSDPKAFLSGAHRVLRPGGTLALSTWGLTDPKWLWIERLLDKYRLNPSAQDQNFDTIDELRQVLSQFGWKNIRTEQTKKVFFYNSKETFWLSLWSHGVRLILESLPADDLQALKEEVFFQLDAHHSEEGYAIQYSPIFTLAEK